ncbi:MAG: 50S ribosomal protein L1 [candidate division WOR-3 bacterium]|jgi:large subunit ribosomal protein L1
MKRSKRYNEISASRSREEKSEIKEAITKIKKMASAKFDETVEVAVKLNVDPKKADQMVRGTILLPHGTGKEKKVLAFAEGEQQVEAEEAGADWVGGQDFVEKIEKGWLECDAIVAVPEMMPKIGKLGKILGPRGLMPTPKTGTVTKNIGQAVQEIKKGKVNFKVDQGGNLHVPVGKASFEDNKLYENFKELIDKIWSVKPSSVGGQYLKGVAISTTMGPSVKIDTNLLVK